MTRIKDEIKHLCKKKVTPVLSHSVARYVSAICKHSWYPNMYSAFTDLIFKEGLMMTLQESKHVASIQ